MLFDEVAAIIGRALKDRPSTCCGSSSAADDESNCSRRPTSDVSRSAWISMSMTATDNHFRQSSLLSETCTAGWAAQLHEPGEDRR